MNPDSDEQKDSEFPISVNKHSDKWLLRAWKDGDEHAAEVLFDRYAIRLIAMVARRLNRRYQAAIDPDEVVQSALGSFFNAARQSRIDVSQSVSLWRLMATFARRKMARRIENHSAAKRGGSHHQVPLETVEPQAPDDIGIDRLDDGHEFLRQLNSELPEELAAVVESLLAGRTQREAAQSLGVDERTIRRRLVRVRELLGRDTASSQTPATGTSQRPHLPVVNYNEFVLGKLIGSGGFGKVYRASMQVDGRRVAVKFLRKAFWEDDFARASFFREINLASKIEHAGIIRYVGWGETPHGGPYLLSQWIDGVTLREASNPSLERFTNWLVQICEALEAVHETGLVHGDLTPSNVLVDNRDHAIITDFGFAQATVNPSLPLPGGTPGFAAPEQIDPCFGSISPRTDIYAVGGLLHWHLLGKPPNEGSNLVTMIAETISLSDNQERRFANSQQPFRSILEGSLCSSPADRFQSVREIKRLLG